MTVDIENFSGVFGNVLGHVEIKGIVRCFKPDRKALSIKINKVNSVTVSNFFIKDLDNSCDVLFSVRDSALFTVKESIFDKNITGNIVSRRCVRNKEEVECSEVLQESQLQDFTIQAVMLVIAVFAFGSISFIVSKVPL